MWLVAIGVIMLVMQTMGWGPLAEWTWSTHWWALLLPFGLAAAWWTWSDLSGRTQRQSMAKMDAKKADRRQKALDAMGLQDPRKRRR